jgi:hypothetical protein
MIDNYRVLIQGESALSQALIAHLTTLIECNDAVGDVTVYRQM